jgi:magnesium transporter
LLLSPSGARIRDVMDEDLISVTTDVDQEEVARVMERYDLVSLPVVTKGGQLLGRITIDDVVDVIREEAEEDFQLMHGVSGMESPRDSVFRISRGRLPWLLVGLFGAGLSASVIGTFEESLETAVVLAMFIPIVTAMGGNAAVQSAAIAVQGLSSGDFWPGDMLKRIGKEFLVALVDGVVLGVLLGLAVWVFQVGDVQLLAMTVSLTLFTVIVLGTTNGAMIPFALHRMGVDPAKSMGPFVTTMNDIIGLTVYFLIATTIYL